MPPVVVKLSGVKLPIFLPTLLSVGQSKWGKTPYSNNYFCPRKQNPRAVMFTLVTSLTFDGRSTHLEGELELAQILHCDTLRLAFSWLRREAHCGVVK